jgi:hypothetical protein
MNTFIISTLSALVLAGGLNLGSVALANAQGFPPCFRGDTMDRDGGPSGALGAPKCGANYAQGVVVHMDRAIG